jgi:hypothetical protein
MEKLKKEYQSYCEEIKKNIPEGKYIDTNLFGIKKFIDLKSNEINQKTKLFKDLLSKTKLGFFLIFDFIYKINNFFLIFF